MLHFRSKRRKNVNKTLIESRREVKSKRAESKVMKLFHFNDSVEGSAQQLRVVVVGRS